jgi:pilus assembly protein CpaF
MQIRELMSQDSITDLVINGTNSFALISGRWQAHPLALSATEVARLAIELCDLGGRHLDLANPFADVSVDGYRVHAVLPAGVAAVPLISIRKHASQVFAVDSELQEIVSSHKNFLISGSTGAGKTTLLRSMLNGSLDRVITIEDVPELAFESPNFVSLVARQANIEGRGEFGVERLFREALRMRPDRIVLGEVRGAEFGLMLQALNTGHAGSAATLHANSLDSVPQRLIGLGLLAGLSPETTKVLAKTAIDVVIHLDGGKPKIARLGELFD